MQAILILSKRGVWYRRLATFTPTVCEIWDAQVPIPPTLVIMVVGALLIFAFQVFPTKTHTPPVKQWYECGFHKACRLLVCPVSVQMELYVEWKLRWLEAVKEGTTVDRGCVIVRISL